MAGVSGSRAGVDSVWMQKKLEVRKCLSKPQTPKNPLHVLVGGVLFEFNRLILQYI